MVKAKIDDETIFNALRDFKGLSEPELEELLGYTKNGLYNRLHSLLRKKKIYCKKIPVFSTSTNLRVLEKYKGLRVYSLNEMLFKEWLISQMPKKVAPLYKRLFTTIVHDLGLEVDMPVSTTKKLLWIYDKQVYALLLEVAKDTKQNISTVAENILRQHLVEPILKRQLEEHRKKHGH